MLLLPMVVVAATTDAKPDNHVGDEVIAQQRLNLAENTRGKGFSPQAPRDIDSSEGANQVLFSRAPSSSEMNLCNIHFHKNAEHSGGQFTTYAGNGDGHGFQTGFLYSGELSAGELQPAGQDICSGKHGGLQSGDTIELHYVHSTAQVKPGPTLGNCGGIAGTVYLIRKLNLRIK